MKFSSIGVVQGYPDGTFKPENFIKRDEFVKIIDGHVDNVFSKYNDVLTSYWAYDYIYKSGIKTGEDKFYPDRDINRADAVYFMYQQSEYGAFADMETFVLPGVITRQIPDEKYVPAIKWAYMSGILIGDNGIDLRLNENVTRAEAICMVDKAKAFDGVYRTSFSDNIPDILLKGLYDRLDLFDSVYEKDSCITNGEICNAALKIMTGRNNPEFATSESKKAGTKYEDAVYFVTDGVFDYYNTKEFAESNATAKTAIELLTYAYAYVSPENNVWGAINSYYPEAGEIQGIYENMVLTYAYNKGVFVNFNNSLNSPITKGQLVSLIIQLEHIIPSQKSYLDGNVQAENIDFETFGFNAASNAIPLLDLPSQIYSKEFYGYDIKNGYRIARDYPDVFLQVVKEITELAKSNGCTFLIRYYPTLVAVSESETVMRCRVYCAGNAFKKTLSEIFGHCDCDDIVPFENTAYIMDISVGDISSYIMSNRVDKISIKQIVWSEF